MEWEIHHQGVSDASFSAYKLKYEVSETEMKVDDYKGNLEKQNACSKIPKTRLIRPEPNLLTLMRF